MHRFANPNRFLRMANAVLPWSAGLTAVLLALGLWIVSRRDYSLKE